jgi:hypothetical protein
MPQSNGPAKEDVEAMIRVDQAGEFGATRIYQGQLAILGDRHPSSNTIAAMAEQEEKHRAFFDDLIAKRGVRPTALLLCNLFGMLLALVWAQRTPLLAQKRQWRARLLSRQKLTNIIRNSSMLWAIMIRNCLMLFASFRQKS